VKAFGRVFAAVCLVAAPVHAGFDYVPVESDRAMFIHAPADRLGIAQVAARIAPAELQLRWDRRVDAGRRVRAVYADWRMLLFDMGLGWARYGDEVHVRPAGLPPGEVELATAGQGVTDWTVRQGETLREVLDRWSAMVGVELAWLTDRSWSLEGSRSFRGTYGEAVPWLMRVLSGADRAPAAALEVDGKTLVVRHRGAARGSGDAVREMAAEGEHAGEGGLPK